MRLDQANCLVREDVRVVRAVEIEGRGTGMPHPAVRVDKCDPQRTC